MSSDYFWADKPAGLTTHTSLNELRAWTDPCDGFLEWLSVRVGELFPVHRLDKETTGVIAFARTREAAEAARVLFEGREVTKEYLFVTDRSTKSKSFEVESFIERKGNDYVSTRAGPANARTTLELVRTEGRYSLWRARPETGKPHQIRLHAEDVGLPLLGDLAHGGTEFPALCLHARVLALAGETHSSPPPVFFDHLRYLNDLNLVRWLAACDRRERALRLVHANVRASASFAAMPFDVTSHDAAAAPAIRALPELTNVEDTNTLRWIHTEGNPLRAEQLGDVVSLNWFRDTAPSEREWQSLQTLLAVKDWRTWYLQIRADRGKDPITDRSLVSEPAPPERWIAHENGLKFEFRRETGLSPGLFLDQRRNRAWLRSHARGKRVLNLFCYTGGFSVAAAAGEAEQVVSVDVSKPFLDWSKRNFELNGLDISRHEFRSIDSGEYLAWAAKKSLKFDFIVCDPPSFARTNTRGKSTVFKIDQELPNLLIKCRAVAASGARILFSTNFEQWTLAEFAALVEKTLGPQARLSAPPSPDLDFELPRTERHMKALVIEI